MKKFFIGVLLLIMSSLAVAQDEETGYEYRESFVERLYLGGNLAFSFSNTSTFINVSPYVGYRVTDEFSVGPGLIYQYNSYRNRITNTSTSYSIYGGSFFARYVFMEYIIMQATYELINYPTILREFGGSIDERANENYLYLGGGIQYPVSDNFWLTVLISYDVLDSPTKFKPHGRNPVYFVGFNLGL